MYDIEEIRANYKNFFDDKIIQIAQHESKGLRPEVLEILKNEIIIRNLDLTLITWIKAETEELTDYEKEEIVRIIKYLPCPTCNSTKLGLRGYEINTVISIIITCFETTETKFLCSHCGKKKKTISIIKTLFLGLWSRRGVVLTPYILIKEIINLFFAERISNRIFDEFIEKNNGRIRLRGITEKALSSLIDNYNKKSDL